MLGISDQWSFYRDRAGEWRWSRYENESIVGASTEGYKNRSDCESNARRLCWQCSEPPVSCKLDRWKVYQDSVKQWRWQRKARNGEIVGASHRGYKARAEAEENASRHGWDRPLLQTSAQTSAQENKPTQHILWMTCNGHNHE